MDEIFDPDTFTVFADYAATFLAGGFGLCLAFWLVGHATGQLLSKLKEV